MNAKEAYDADFEDSPAAAVTTPDLETEFTENDGGEAEFTENDGDEAEFAEKDDDGPEVDPEAIDPAERRGSETDGSTDLGTCVAARIAELGIQHGCEWRRRQVRFSKNYNFHRQYYTLQ